MGTPASAEGVCSTPMRDCCSIDECYRHIFRGEYCGAHYKRHQRNKTVTGLVVEKLNPEERVIKLGNAWLDCSAENDKEARYRRSAFLRAAEVWLQSRGWRPPLARR